MQDKQSAQGAHRLGESSSQRGKDRQVEALRSLGHHLLDSMLVLTLGPGLWPWVRGVPGFPGRDTCQGRVFRVLLA